VQWLALFTLSGFGGLIFQVVWTRKLGLLLGSTIQSASITSSSFLLGLSLGAYFAGRVGATVKNPLRRFAQLEMAIAVSGLTVTFLIPALHRVVAYKLTLLLAVVLILIPALFMGATLPLLTQYHTLRSSSFVKVLAFLYAANTLGAAAGAFCTDFLLVKELGVNGTAFVAAGCDSLVALLAFVLSNRASGRATSAATNETNVVGSIPKLPLLLIAVAGFCGLGLEIAWTRLLVFFNGTDIYAFSLVLSIYLFGIVIGSLLVGQLGPRVAEEWLLVGLLLFLAAWVWLSMFGLEQAGQLTAWLAGDLSRTARRIASCFVLLLVPTTVLGAIFPTATGLVQREALDPARSVGYSYLWNTVGSVSGALITGFVFLPRLGLQNTLQVLCSVAALGGTIALLHNSGWKKRLASLVGFLLLVCAWWVTPSSMLLTFFYDRGGDRLIYATDDHYGAVALIEQFNVTEAQHYKNLIVDGYNMAGNSLNAQRYTTQLGLLPAVLGSEPKDVLIVALGLANTLTILESLDTVQRIDCVELSSKVPETIRHLDRVPPVLDSDKVNLIIGDGRHHLLTTTRTYDVITAEPPPPTEAGIVILESISNCAVDVLTRAGWWPIGYPSCRCRCLRRRLSSKPCKKFSPTPTSSKVEDFSSF
jgi:spermidine synthase